LRVFISAGSDLEAEREVIGKAIAGLPVSLGWVINYTPTRDEPLVQVQEAVAASHFYALVMGPDIRAPVGSELYIARQRGKQILAFLKEGPRTPAGLVFVREASLEWNHFRREDELGPLLQRSLADQILASAQIHSISPVDWETLSAFHAELRREEGSAREREEVAPGYHGAGSDAVIVAPGRDLPSEGVLIEKPGPKS
jgi:hypothetical protein